MIERAWFLDLVQHQPQMPIAVLSGCASTLGHRELRTDLPAPA